MLHHMLLNGRENTQFTTRDRVRMRGAPCGAVRITWTYKRLYVCVVFELYYVQMT